MLDREGGGLATIDRLAVTDGALGAFNVDTLVERRDGASDGGAGGRVGRGILSTTPKTATTTFAKERTLRSRVTVSIKCENETANSPLSWLSLIQRTSLKSIYIFLQMSKDRGQSYTGPSDMNYLMKILIWYKFEELQVRALSWASLA